MPTLTMWSGNNQTNAASTYTPLPLVVKVTDISSVPLTNAPVMFTATRGGGMMSVTNSGVASSSLLVRTDINGYAQAYYRQPADIDPVASTISSTAANQSVNFSEQESIPTSGLAVWLKADAVGGVAGANVYTWYDQSPNGNNAVQYTGGSQPQLVYNAINGHPAVQFNGGGWWLYVPDNSSIEPATGLTMFAVFQQNDGGGFEKLIDKPYRNAGWSYPYIAYEMDSASGSSTQPDTAFVTSGGNLGVQTGFAIAPGTPTILSSKYDGSSVGLYANGNFTTEGSLTGSITYADPTALYIGVRENGGEWFNGYISEILIYNQALSDADQESVEIYLSQKYGLPLAPPPISPAGGTFSSSTSVSFSSMPSNVAIRYTLDGSTPTSASTSYTGTFTLTQSCPVNYALFANNLQVSSVGTAQFLY